MTTAWCLPLSEPDAASLAVAGGKGANLAELVGAGFDVPPGFVVTTDAYRHAVSGIERPDRALVERVELPAEVTEAVLEAYGRLGRGAVAVRSSATAEDLAGAAFAGQQDTFLGVVGDEEVLTSVRQCWASLWNDRAIAYRARLGIAPDSIAIAVVVQRMVAADHAGVMLTADPVTGARDRVVIDSNPGLGEAVVSGLVTPDHYLLDEAGAVIERTAGRREALIRMLPDGGTETVTGAATAQTGTPSDAELARLAALGRRIAAHFGRPQDIEWALVDGEVAVLQARPMTALPPAPIPLSRVQRITGPVILELLPRRPYPMELDAWIQPNIGRHLEGLVDGLIGAHVAIADVVPDVDGVVQSYVPPNPHPTARTPGRLLRSLSRAGRNPGQWIDDPRYASFRAGVDRLTATPVTELGWTDLLAVPAEAARLTDLITELRVAYLPAAGSALARLVLLLKALGQGGLFKDLVIDAPTKTQALNAELAHLADLVRATPALSRRFAAPDADDAALWELIERDPGAADVRTAFTALLDRYGHRETTSILLSRDPCWLDSPQTVVALVRVLASGPERPSADRSRHALARLGEHRLLRHPRVRTSVERLVAKAAAGIAVREDTHFELTRTMPAVHRAVEEVGRRLAASGAIDDPALVWDLTWAEVLHAADPALGRPGADLAASASRRRAAYAELSGAPLIATVTLYPERGDTGQALVAGAGGGGGRAAGSVRVIHDPSEFGRLRDGEVLVCPATNPSWTPLFARAAAVVVDHGGLASHAAIVAREYGIPAVLGCGTATSVLTEGTRVLVDGDRGLVLPADEGDGV